MDSISTVVQGATMDSCSSHLKKKNHLISFEMFLFPIPFPHFHSEVTTILNFVFIIHLFFFAVLAHLCISTQYIAWFTCVWTWDNYEGIILFVWRLTSFALILLCFIHIFVYTRESFIFTYCAHIILLIFIWFILNCLLPFPKVLFLLSPYSEYFNLIFFFLFITLPL